jgi:hypothetical protein
MGAKSGKTSMEKQDAIIAKFAKTAKYGKSQDITKSTKAQKKNIKAARTPFFISVYDPNNPLNGSSSWSKMEWENYKATGDSKNYKRIK